MPSQAEKKPVIYLIGTAGNPNYGDELITAGWLRHYARHLPDAEVWLDSPRPGQAAVLMDGLHPGLRCVDTLFHACWNAPTDHAADTLGFGARAVTEPGLLPREATSVENLGRADLVHIVGGGYINSYWPQHLALVGAAQAMAARYGTRLALTGAGLMPLVESSRDLLAASLADFDVVDVRDEPTHEAFTHDVARTTMTGDDSLLSLGGDPIFGSEGAVRTMLCVQADMLDVPLEQVADYVVRTLQGWGVDRDPITLVECNPPVDSAVLDLLGPQLPQLKLLPFSHLWRGGFPAGPGQRWVTTRLHPHLVAAAAGAWGLAVPVSSAYYRTKHDAVARLGSGWTVAPDLGDALPAGSLVGEPFGGRLPAIVAAKRKVAERVVVLARADRA